MLEGIISGHALIVAPIVLIAYFVRGICGFGSGLIAIPALSLVIPLTVAVPLVVILDYLASAGQGINQRQSIQWDEIRRLIIPGLFGVSTGLLVFHQVNTELLTRFLGGFVFSYALYSLWAPNLPKVSGWWSVPAAFCGGAIGTLFGTGGPFYVTYLKARLLDKNSFRATFASIFLLDGAARISGYVGTSIIDIYLLQLLSLCLPLMILGMYIGGKLHIGLTPQTFTRIISCLLLVSGASLILR